MYWDQVLKEVLNKKDSSYPCVFTNIKKPLQVEEPSVESYHRQAKKKELRVYLGGVLHAIYFTRRESQCMLLLMEGKTMKESGSKLNLSSRTIEYYVKNMKVKTKARSRAELVRLVMSSHFMKNVKRIGLKEPG